MPPLKALLNFFYTENTKLSWPMMQDTRSFQKKIDLTNRQSRLWPAGVVYLLILVCEIHKLNVPTHPMPVWKRKSCAHFGKILPPLKQKNPDFDGSLASLASCATKPVTYHWSTKKKHQRTTTRPETNHIALKPCYYTLSIDLIYVPSYLASPVQSLSTAIMYD